MSASISDPDVAAVLPVRWSVVALLLLSLISLPIVVCMPLTSDTVLYDLQARNILDGGVMYRDILEPNLPGAVWIHLLVRSIAGWSSEVMRCADLFIVAAACLILAGLISIGSVRDPDERNNGLPVRRFTAGTTGGLLAMAAFYLSRNEWCHCQRDSWMLLPVVLAAAIRITSHEDAQKTRNAMVRLRAVGEGLCWGAAFWIKPHVALIAIAVFSTDVWIKSDRRSELSRLLWVILGGILAAVPGVAWMFHSGAWPHFREMQLNWNPEYVAAAGNRRSWQRVWSMLVHFHPWWMVHIPAIGRSLQVLNAVRISNSAREHHSTAQTPSHQPATPHRAAAIISVIYLSWFAQASLLQHSMDYIQVPPVMLAIVLVSMTGWTIPLPVRRTALAAFAMLALIASPQIQPAKIMMWRSCFRSGSSPQMNETLACVPLPDWGHIAPVTKFLQNQNVRAGDVTCFNVHCIHVYRELQIPPSTRYVGISSLLELFPSRRSMIEQTVQKCGHRFVVVDVRETEPRSDQFPWNLPLAFQSGGFRVYAAQQAGITKGAGTKGAQHPSDQLPVGS